MLSLRYVKGTMNFCLKYKRGKKLSLIGYCDCEYGGDLDDMKNTSGAFFFLGENIVTWMS